MPPKKSNPSSKSVALKACKSMGIVVVHSPQQKSDMSIHVQGHAADPVHGVIGFNSSTGGTVSTEKVGKLKETALIIKEAWQKCFG